MTSSNFVLAVDNSESIPSYIDQLNDHSSIIDGYLETLLCRNFVQRTRIAEERILNKWFKQLSPPEFNRPMFVWEAMEPIRGRERIKAFVTKLFKEQSLSSSTILNRMGVLRRFFEYVLEWPYIPNTGGVSISARYGPIEQPVLNYDYPVHAWYGRKEDAPLTRTELNEFYKVIHKCIDQNSRRRHVVARNYSMFVIAAESGLRISEIIALEIERDLLFSSNRIQTRAGKGVRGSGPRVRQTIYTPFAQATIRHYMEHYRPRFKRWSQIPFLFLSEQGSALSEANAKYALKQIIAIGKEVGLRIPPRFGWHSLRRSFATIYMQEHSDSPWVLMEMLGHSNPSTLHHYIHHPRAYHERVMDEVISQLVPR